MKSGTRASLRADNILPEQRLVLRAAGCSTAFEAASAWDDFRRVVPEGTEDPSTRRLLPAVCRNLARLAGVRDAYLLQAYAQSFGASARILANTARAVRVLNDASIPAMALKGTALLVAHYRDNGIRPMADADILVPESRIEDALNVLMADGWRGDATHAWLRTEIHAGSLALSGTTLDLHRHALYEARYPAAMTHFSAPLSRSRSWGFLAARWGRAISSSTPSSTACAGASRHQTSGSSTPTFFCARGA